MNIDDPKLTAYVLEELEPEERAALERALQDDPAQAAEVAELRALTARLRTELAAEGPVGLTEARRAALLREAQAPTLVVPRRPWRVWMPTAIAATLMILLGASYWQHWQAERLQSYAPVDDAGVPATAAASPRRTDPAPTASNEPAVKAKQMAAPPADAPAPAPDFVEAEKDSAKLAPESAPMLSVPTPAAPMPTLAPSGGMEHPLPLRSPAATPAPLVPAATAVAPKVDAISAAPRSAAKDAGRTVVMGPMFTLRRDSADPLLAQSQAPLPGKSAGRAMRLAPAPAEPATAQPVGKALAENLGDNRTPLVGDPKDKEFEKMPVRPEKAPTDFYTRRRWSEPSGERYEALEENAFLNVREQPLSTFSIDVDTASYTNVKRMLQAHQRPPEGAVRVEEMINYFTYDYPAAPEGQPCSVTMEVAGCPWQPQHRLLRVGLKAREVSLEKRPAANLVFLFDVSGSMQPANRLPLAVQSLRMLVDQLRPEDRVAIAVYAGSSGTVLEPTSDKGEIRAALERLEAGGSTNGAAGIQLAYELARRSFVAGQINRVILATDGDFNVGVTSQEELLKLIAREAKGGVFLTVLGFGYGNLKDATLQKIADRGNGNYAYVNDLTEGRRVLVEQMSGTLLTVAKDVKLQLEFNPAHVSAYRLIGYEKRRLENRDFNDDTKDAGEMGSGQTVTALYEVVPAGVSAPGAPSVDALKYAARERAKSLPEPVAPAEEALASPELLTLKLRWKSPEGERSSVKEFPLVDPGTAWAKASPDFRWAAAVASYGMMLRESPHRGTATWDSVRELAVEGKGTDRGGYRQEFLSLVDLARELD